MRRFLRPIELVEVGPEHQHFTPHLEHFGRVIGLQAQRNRLDRADVRGDLLARRAVATRGCLHEHPALIA